MVCQCDKAYPRHNVKDVHESICPGNAMWFPRACTLQTRGFTEKTPRGVLICRGLGFMSQDKLGYLREHGVIICQGLDLLLLHCLVVLTL